LAGSDHVPLALLLASVLNQLRECSNNRESSMGPVVVGVDSAGDQSAALQWAVQWCLDTGAELVAVRTAASFDTEVGSPRDHDEAIAASCQALEQRITALDQDRPLRHRSLALDQGDPRWVIPNVAADEDASLVVVGARGDGGFLGLGLGSVAHHLAHDVRRPLAIVPKVGGPLAGGTIVVGVDGSKGSGAALDWAVHAASALGARVHALYAYNPRSDDFTHTAANWQYAGEPEVRGQVAEHEAAGVAIRLTVLGDHPVPALTGAAEEDNAALVVVGTRGLGGFQGLLLGRVPAQLPHHSRRPTVLVHHP
jgi:nucleotide-binding universal stress UspA family protein